jgi:hypothetical protein
MVPNITRKMVLDTLHKFDRVGGRKFLHDSGFRNSTGYDLVYGGKRYPPKAIFGVAQKLSSRDTHGGKTVNEPLRRLGFAIIEKGEFAGFDAADLEDLPSRDEDYTTQMSIRIRRGQNKYRKALLRIYENKCAVTGCTALPLLDAAHINPYAEGGEYETCNGIILRTDIHTLFDEGLLMISPKDLIVQIHDSVRDKYYRMFHKRRKVFQPSSPKHHIRKDYLLERWQKAAWTQ